MKKVAIVVLVIASLMSFGLYSWLMSIDREIRTEQATCEELSYMGELPIERCAEVEQTCKKLTPSELQIRRDLSGGRVDQCGNLR